MAQNRMICQFCETSNDIKWKCINCELILCDDCNRKIHTKIKASEEHTVIDLKQIGTIEATETIRKLDLKNILCSVHENEKCSLYCKKCVTSVCSLCILKIHRNHDLTKLNDVYNDQANELKSLKDAVDRDWSFFSENVNRLSKMKLDRQKNYNSIKQKIREREKQMKEQVTMEAEDLIKELDEHWIPQNDIILTEEQKLRKHEQDLKQRKAEIDTALQSQQAMSILTTIGQINKKLPARTISEIPRQQVAFVAQDSPNVAMNFRIMMKIPNMINTLETYEIGVPTISNLKTLKNKTNVIYDDKYLRYFVLQDSKPVTCDTAVMDVKVFDMTITEDDRILISRYYYSDIMSVTEDGKIENFSSIQPRKPRGIHISSDQNIIVGFIDIQKHEFYEFGIGDVKGGIMILGRTGNRKKTFKLDENNERLLTYPDRITTNINGDICIVDRSTFFSDGRIVVLGSNGILKWTYKGHEIINPNKSFSPSDVVTTFAGLITVADTYSNTIQVLSMNGDFLSSIGEQEGIYRPKCLNISKDGQLQIGCNGKDEEMAKIVVAKLCD